MTVHVRPATAADTRAMARLLNAIIERGGTTAMTRPVRAETLAEWMANDGARGAWRLAEDETGALLGFQWIGPHDGLPPRACDIATFVAIDQTGIGVGSALFEATKPAARMLGYAWINAAIRADNTGGLAYYRSRGFEDWRREEAVTLESGETVTRVFKRYDLD